MDSRTVLTLSPRNDVPAEEDFPGLIGRSEVMRKLFTRVRRGARCKMPVLIHGETGTGKEAIARGFHTESPWARGPYVVFNCSELRAGLATSQLFGHERGAFTGAERATDGLFVSADGGTLVLDEVGELPLDLQATLLRALENGVVRPLGSTRTVPVDVRLVACSHVDLPKAVRERRFREDLFQRIHGMPVEVPPLRDRPGDLRLLANHFLARLGTERGPLALTAEAYARLEAHPFSGNVRELKLTLERSVVLADNPAAITADELILNPCLREADELTAEPSADDPEWIYLPGKSEREVTTESRLKAVRRRQGNKRAAARDLQVSPMAFYRQEPSATVSRAPEPFPAEGE